MIVIIKLRALPEDRNLAVVSRRYLPTFLTEWALNLLDPDTGDCLSHRQLRRHPKLGPTWDVSYSKELGRLCQGLGKESTGTGQRVKGTDTFRPVHFSDIPLNRTKGIIVTSVVC